MNNKPQENHPTDSPLSQDDKASDIANTTTRTTDDSSLLIPAPGFYAIYKELHNKFPTIINMDKPVLLAVGIRKEMLREVSVTNVILNKWIRWYFRKSGYYSLHKIGAARYNLDGTEAGIVTPQDQEKRDMKLKKPPEQKPSASSAKQEPGEKQE